MSDIDEIRSALGDATRLPGDVQARPTAASSIRARARRRRRTTLLASAVAVPACVVLVAALAGVGGSGPVRKTVPASGPTPAASPTSAVPSVAISFAPGPRTFDVPIGVHPVRQHYLSCPSGEDTVPAAEGSSCYRLGPAALMIRQVRDLTAGPATSPNGLVTDGALLMLTLTNPDSAAWSSITGELVNNRKQVALVVDGKVYVAFTAQTRVTGGRIAFNLGSTAARSLGASLAG